MKTFLIPAFILVLNIVSLSAQDNLRIRDPNLTWKFITGGITQAEYIVRPGKNIVTCDLYLTYECKGNNFVNDYQYELVHNFSLPVNTLITDSWLWVDTVIMKADILERNEAINIYEGVVNRRRDPSLLLKNSSTAYSFNIYPIFNNNTRRVKLRFEIPVELEKHERTFSLPTGLLLTALTKPVVTIKVIDDENYDLTLDDNTPLELVNDSRLGMVYQAVVTPETETITLKIKNEDSQPKLSYAVESESNPPVGLYQLSLHPSKVFEISTHDEKNVLLLIDHDSIFSHLNKSAVILAVQDFIFQYLQPGDSLQIMYNGAGVKKHYADFMPYENILSSSPIKNIKPGNFSSAPGSIFLAYDELKNKSNPVLVIFSSAGNVTTTANAQSIKDELERTYGTLIKTFALSYVNEKAPGLIYSSVGFRGNNLLYTILTSNSGGHIQITPTTVKTFSSWKPHRILFGNQFDALTQKSYEVQYSFKTHDGLTYDNITLKDDVNGRMQIGRFAGTPPFTLDAVIWIDNQVSQRSLTFEGVEQTEQLSRFRQFHQGHRILQMENTNLTGNKFNIINASLDHRVLSRYTAFLALEPGMQDPCPDCVDESTTSVDDIAENVSWKVYPNPFADKVVIELKGLQTNEKPGEVALYNIRGEKQSTEIYVTSDKDVWRIEIHGGHLPAGVYLVKVHVGNRILTCKVVKI